MKSVARTCVTPTLLHDAVSRVLADWGHPDALVAVGLRVDRTEYDYDIYIKLTRLTAAEKEQVK